MNYASKRTNQYSMLRAICAAALITAGLLGTEPVLAQSNPMVFAVPTPNGGAIVGGQINGNGGIITHQPLGSGYTSNGLQFGTRGGTTFGGNVVTNPSNGVIGGGASVGWTFR